jgi:uncharacterized glyoxalase superfamily protein PhnB
MKVMTYKKLTPNLVVHDVNAAVEFYTSVLAFQKVASVPETGTLNWAMLQAGDVTIMLQALASMHGDEGLPWFTLPTGNDGALLYIDVSDVRALRASVEGHAEVVKDLHGTFYGTTEFAIRDPFGYVLSFAQDEPKEA